LSVRLSVDGVQARDVALGNRSAQRRCGAFTRQAILAEPEMAAMAPLIRNNQVLVVGAGPTGLVLALWLTRLGVRVRLVDKAAAPGTTSRALAVQARTLELYGQAGLADGVVARGRKAVAANFWVAGRKVAHVVLGDIGAGLSPYPYALIFPQDEHERLIINRLAEQGVTVERGTELLGFEAATGQVLARLKRPDGTIEACEAAYIAGCDGAHSAVRQALKISFSGGTYEHLFYVADVEATGAAMNGEAHIGMDKSDFLAVFPLKSDGRARLVGTIREATQHQRETLSWDDVGQRVMAWMNIDVARVNWLSTYHVHHRVADRFRDGCAFLLGDAAHIHSPVGGQGMNTGIGDAINLAWKLAAVLRGRGTASLLDSYEPERIAFAQRLVATTDRVFTGVTNSGVIARRVRLNLVPFLIPLLFALPAVRRLMFRTVSQTAVNYRGSSLSNGRAGTVRGGDRLPWVRAALSGGDNYAPLTSLDWQVHVYGEARPQLRAACEARRLPLHVFQWRPETRQVGLRRHAAYLVRPDGYVALADPEGSATALTSYLTRWNISCGHERPPIAGQPPAEAASRAE
jgi:2-polyprenyl-6-methoxyphenol hydroxylase-like FAD-dependent oxidoreductase